MINAFLQFPELTFGINKNSSEEFLIELQMLRDGSIDYLVIPQISNATQRFVLIFVGNESDSYRKEKNELRLFFSPDAFDYIMYIITASLNGSFQPRESQ